MVLIRKFSPLAIAVVCFGLVSCGTDRKKEGIVENAVGPAFKFENTEHDYGQIPFGIPVRFIYQFENVGTDTLKIDTVKASCGCTNVDYTHKPVPPGKKGYVQAGFNAQKEGVFKKTVSIISNSNVPIFVLSFKGEVLPEEK